MLDRVSRAGPERPGHLLRHLGHRGHRRSRRARRAARRRSSTSSWSRWRAATAPGRTPTAWTPAACSASRWAAIPDVEMTEFLYPVLTLWRREEPDSGGPGRQRGGRRAPRGDHPARHEPADGPGPGLARARPSRRTPACAAATRQHRAGRRRPGQPHRRAARGRPHAQRDWPRSATRSNPARTTRTSYLAPGEVFGDELAGRRRLRRPARPASPTRSPGDVREEKITAERQRADVYGVVVEDGADRPRGHHGRTRPAPRPRAGNASQRPGRARGKAGWPGRPPARRQPRRRSPQRRQASRGLPALRRAPRRRPGRRHAGPRRLRGTVHRRRAADHRGPGRLRGRTRWCSASTAARPAGPRCTRPSSRAAIQT